jgi:hypothetical protein
MCDDTFLNQAWSNQSGGIQGEGKMFYGPFVDFVIESKEDSEASV